MDARMDARLGGHDTNRCKRGIYPHPRRLSIQSADLAETYILLSKNKDSE